MHTIDINIVKNKSPIFDAIALRRFVLNMKKIFPQ